MLDLDQCENTSDIYKALNKLTLPIDRLDKRFKQQSILTANDSLGTLHLLRLDLIHPIVSGNKLFKLLPFFQLAERNQCQTLVSFGGRFSNHLHALAYLGRCFGFKTVAFVRGYIEQDSTPMLDEVRSWGMQIHFVGNSEYKSRHLASVWQDRVSELEKALLIPEGGADFECEASFDRVSSKEAQWLAEYRQQIAMVLDTLLQRSCQAAQINNLQVLATAVGSAGFLQLLMQLPRFQFSELVGVLALKNEKEISNKITEKPLIDTSAENDKRVVKILTSYDCGGFAKVNIHLIELMNEIYACTGIALDPIYNAKLLMAVVDCLNNKQWQGKSILLVDSGGLQGSRGLANKMTKLYGKPLNFAPAWQ